MTGLEQKFTGGLADIGVSVPAEGITRLAIYFTELLKWRVKMNLVAKNASEDELFENHFLDSLTLLPELEGKCHLLDIGTGGGFPGLVCKAARPELGLTLVEPRQKRVSFLRHMVRTLGLDDAVIHDCRIEDERRVQSDGGFTHITCRAVTEVGPFLQMVTRFAPARPVLLLMKGPKWQDEMAGAGKVLEHSPYVPDRVEEFVLPYSKARRALLIFKVK